MDGLTLAFLGLALTADPIELPKDVYEMPDRRFALPLQFDPKKKEQIERVRLFVSEDRGKTWKHKEDYKPSDDEMIFKAPRDGHFWFALQVVSKDGKSDPAKKDELTPAMKVYVNTEQKALKVVMSNENLQREVEELRRIVEQLQKRVKDLEAHRKPK